MLAPETILQGRYRIVRLLGQGGMGAVYEAIDQRLDKTVALKETLFIEDRLRKQFEREARLLARLHHPALPGVSDHFAEGDGEFLVMQYVPGEDLSTMLARRQEPFPPHQVLAWADQLLDALDYLHTQDPPIIHRDIKPQNLKLAARGQIVLLDFGLAKGSAGELSRVTSSASIFGYTPNYAPLEQVQGLGTDGRSDLYSLGATFYHLLTGSKPADALTRAAAIVNGHPDPLKSAQDVNPAIDSNLAAVLDRAMSQKRTERYATATEMRRALSGTAGVSTVITGAEAATVLFSSSPTIPVAAPTKNLTAAAPSGETTVLRGSQASSKKRISPLAIAAAIVVLLGGGFGVFYAYQHRHAASTNGQPDANTQPVVATASAGNDSNAPAKPDKETAKADAPKPNAAKKEEATKKKVKPTERPSANSNKPAGNTAAKSPDPPPAPGTPDLRRTPPGPNPRGRRGPPEGSRVRTFPDGTRVVIAPNGTRVVTFPDGTTRVFRPGEKIRRRP